MISQCRSRKRGFTVVELLVVFSMTAVSLSLTLPSVQQAREKAREIDCKNRHKKIGLAMHNYHDTYNTFPPGWVSRRPQGEGHPSTGWSTSILPFLEQAQLYNELNLGAGTVYEPRQPDPGSQMKLKMMLKQPVIPYLCSAEPPGDTNPFRGDWGMSSFSANYGSKPIARSTELDFFPGQTTTFTHDQRQGARSDGLFYVNSRVGFRDITDGTSNTILGGERSVIGRGGIWPGPRSNFHESDVVSDGSFASTLNGSETGYSSRHNGGIYFVICDGSVRFIRSDVESRPTDASLPQGGIFQKLCSCNGGEVIGEF